MDSILIGIAVWLLGSTTTFALVRYDVRRHIKGEYTLGIAVFSLMLSLLASWLLFGLYLLYIFVRFVMTSSLEDVRDILNRKPPKYM